MKFIHVTDLHLVPPGENLFGHDPLERFKLCLGDVARHHSDASFCVITGDLTEKGDAESYRALREALSILPFPVHLLLGNCDNRANFRTVFGSPAKGSYVQSSLPLPGRLCLFLDTLAQHGGAAGEFDEARLSWLREELGGLGPRRALLFMHHPPFDIFHANDAIRLREVAAFEAAIAGPAVEHIFFGHVHRPVSGRWKGIGYSALPGLCFQLPLVNGSTTTRMSDEPPMYAVVHLDEDQITVHSDAFLNRKPAQMPVEAERDDWF